MSCLFNSLGQLLRIPTNDMRQKICDYLAENKPIMDGMATSDILAFEHPNYVANMRNSHVWGGEPSKYKLLSIYGRRGCLFKIVVIINQQLNFYH